MFKLFILIVLICFSSCKSQKNTSETFLNNLIDDSINIIGKEIPNTYTFEKENRYVKKIEKTEENPIGISIVLTINTGLVESCDLIISLSEFDEAKIVYNSFIKYLKNENWKFIKYISKYKRTNGALYQKDGLYYGIYEPTPLTIPMCISKNIELNYFYEDDPERMYDIGYYRSKIIEYRNFFDERQEISSIIELKSIVPGFLTFLVCWNDNVKGYIYELYKFDNNQNVVNKYLVGYGPFLNNYRNTLMEKLTGQKVENELIAYGNFNNDRFSNIISYSLYPNIGYVFSVFGYSVIEDDFVELCLVPIYINFENTFPPVEYIGNGFRVLEVVDTEFLELAWNNYKWDVDVKKYLRQ